MIANSKTQTILPIVLTMVLSIGVFGCSGDSTNLESNENYVADTIAYVTPTGWEESDLLSPGLQCEARVIYNQITYPSCKNDNQNSRHVQKCIWR